ncbi:polysaccharide biosynthesis tyrosine autokinase [Croceicoccus ponticola]|uniref:non-specific protein-tyrosine kinase n=2 Tax=Croceicoccus ponticola TaxID=2217664 RepID=A0A437GYV0_9SPHN|nr:polysaccharide biosynthesis tyrosine autokinase [Croceicoccus ponticola]
MPPGYPTAGTNISAFIRYGLSLVRRNIIPIALILAAAVAAAVVLTMLDTPRYTATTTVQINDQSDKVLGDDMDTEANVNAGWDVERFLNTQLEVLRSREVAERVANELNLFEDPAFFAAMEVPVPDGAADATLRREAVVGLVQGSIGVDLPRETRVVRISVTSANPEMSARIANGFADQFIQSSLQRRYDSSSYARKFIADQLAQSRGQLEASERELNAYARQAGLLRNRGAQEEGNSSVNGSGSVTIASLDQLNEAANQASATRIQAEARWRAEEAQAPLSSPTVLANPTVQQLMTDRARVDAKIQTLRARYLDDYPEIVQLEAERTSINQQLQSVARSVRDGIRSEYLGAQTAERRLRDQVGTLQGETLAEQDRSVRYNTLAREADTNRSIYDGLLQRYRELNASAGISTSNLSIVDKAQVPRSPSSPNLIKNLMIAILLGLMAAAAFILLRDQLDDTIRVPEDVEAKMHMPLLGVVPTSQDDNPTNELLDPKSPMSEAYNSLRGALMYSTANGLPRILQVTSSQPGEGKSTSSNAIARGFARMGKRVVLIDADLRRPSEHKHHNLPNDRGLSDLLTGARELDATIMHEVAPNLYVITSGPIPPSPTELLSGPRFAHLLEQLSAQFDCVVIDSPPVLGLADAPVMSALADGVVFVVEASRSRSGMLKTAVRRLRAMNPVILGAVLTKFDPAAGANRYSEYYGYEYYRYSNADDAKA